jgi:hypothetical protein
MFPRKEIGFTPTQYEFFDGVMAGDAHIERNGCFRIDVKYKEFAQYVITMLELDSNINKSIHKGFAGKRYISYVSTKMNILFLKERRRWYPRNIKRIPKNFRISPIGLNILYLCDGMLTKWNSIIISINSFRKNDIEKYIVSYLLDNCVDCWVRKNNSIYISAKSRNLFLDLVGSCPLQCYSYKWDYNDISNRDIVLVRGRQSKIHLGKKLSKKHKKEISRGLLKYNRLYENSKPSFIVIKNKNIIGEWKSQTKCAKDLGLNNAAISLCLRGKQETHKGYKFHYAKDDV